MGFFERWFGRRSGQPGERTPLLANKRVYPAVPSTNGEDTLNGVRTFVSGFAGDGAPSLGTATQGLHAVTQPVPVDLAYTGPSMGAAVVLAESVEVYQIVRNCFRDRRAPTSNESLFALRMGTRAGSVGVAMANTAHASMVAGSVVPGLNASIAGISTLLSGLAVCDARTRCREVANALVSAAEGLAVDVSTPGVDVRQHIINQVQHYQRTQDFSDAQQVGACLMLQWLARKYRRHLNGAVVSGVQSAGVCGLSIGMAVVVAVGSAATGGMLGAAALGIGAAYLMGSQAWATRGACKSNALFRELRRSMTAALQGTPALTQEEWLFQLADRLHPWRHAVSGTTFGDYMRVKIASVAVGSGTEAENAVRDLMRVAIGYNPAKYAALTGDVNRKILAVANSIPIRGY
ncbi:MAG: hypothetical protein A3J38_03970 [Gammaproteobacteria bacterium RIFCSPHIGHO2_12_FULL_45_9]|nr:MAG: hypothetical protein A3J38_03970 [Gammaproteobacteria bacterium RIFCSPHIGHO2_12_FULL_45_9]